MEPSYSFKKNNACVVMSDWQLEVNLDMKMARETNRFFTQRFFAASFLTLFFRKSSRINNFVDFHHEIFIIKNLNLIVEENQQWKKEINKFEHRIY
jgi:hypothetical protein